MSTIVSYSGKELQEMKDEVDRLKGITTSERDTLDNRLANYGLDGTAKQLLDGSIKETKDMLDQLDEKIKKFQEGVEAEQGNEQEVLKKVKNLWG